MDAAGGAEKKIFL